MNSIERIFIALLLFVFTGHAYSQFNTNAPQTSIPPAPEAANLGKFVDVPVDHYNGLAQISVPLYTLTERDLNLSMSLSYHSRGHKVTEIASWVGLGWSLNAGGVITREVRNIPDDYPGVIATDYLTAISIYTMDSINKVINRLDSYNDGNQVGQDAQDAILVADLLSGGCIDLEPDVFYINLNGLNVKFAFDQNGEIVIGSDQRILIDYTTAANGEITGWTVVTPDGMEYLFEARENTRSIRAGNSRSISCSALWDDLTYTSSWFLTKMTSRITGHYFDFEYQDYSIDHGFTESESFSHSISEQITPLCANLGFFSPSIQTVNNTLTTSGKRLSRIVSKSGTEIKLLTNGVARTDVTNTNAYSLDSIKVFNMNGQQVKAYEFEYDYSIGSANDRLTLKRIWEVGTSGEKLPPYVFKYNSKKLPSRDSKAQDYWGYYNGKSSNAHLVPPLLIKPLSLLSNDMTYFTGANRDPSEAHTKAGILERIEYPTAGWRSFTYELNDFSYISRNSLESLNYFECSPTKMEFYKSGENSFSVKRDTVLIPIKGPVRYTIEFSEPPLLGDLQTTTPYFELFKLDSLNNSTSLLKQEWANAEFKGYLFLDSGNYVIETFAMAIDGSRSDYVYASLSWKYCGQSAQPISVQVAGGLRVKEIEVNDGFSSETIKTSFDYRDENGRSTGVFASWASLPEHETFARVDFPYYPYESLNTLTYQLDGFPPPYINCTVINRSASPSYQLGSGSHIEYAQVKITNGTSSGTQVQSFTSSKDSGFNDNISFESPVLPPISNAHKRGRPILNRSLDNQSRNIKEDTFGYQYGHADISAVKLAMNCSCTAQDPANFRYSIRELRLGYYRSALNASKFYYDHGGSLDSLLTNQTFEYNEEGLVVKQELQKSDVGTRITKYKYPTDYAAGVDLTIDSLVSKNQIVSPIEQSEWDDTNLTASVVTAYTLSNGVAVPDTTYVRDNKTSGYAEPTDGNGDFTQWLNDPNAYHTGQVILAYDADNRVTDFRTPDGLEQSIVWGYDGTLPIANIFNASSDQTIYEGFEENPLASSVSSTKSGSKVYSTTADYVLATSGLINGTYNLSYWTKQPTDVAWVRQDTTINYTGQSIIIENPYGTSTYYLDEVRLHPPDARMRTYCYIPTLGRISEVDENGRATYYEYDEFGRLMHVLDNDRHLIRRIQYNYSNTN